MREENLAAGREKVEAVSEAREKARDEIQRELDQLREQLATVRTYFNFKFFELTNVNFISRLYYR